MGCTGSPSVHRLTVVISDIINGTRQLHPVRNSVEPARPWRSTRMCRQTILNAMGGGVVSIQLSTRHKGLPQTRKHSKADIWVVEANEETFRATVYNG